MAIILGASTLFTIGTGQVALAELCLVHGTPFLLICGGEPERDLLGARLGTELARQGLRAGFGRLGGNPSHLEWSIGFPVEKCDH